MTASNRKILYYGMAASTGIAGIILLGLVSMNRINGTSLTIQYWYIQLITNTENMQDKVKCVIYSHDIS